MSAEEKVVTVNNVSQPSCVCTSFLSSRSLWNSSESFSSLSTTPSSLRGRGAAMAKFQRMTLMKIAFANHRQTAAVSLLLPTRRPRIHYQWCETRGGKGWCRAPNADNTRSSGWRTTDRQRPRPSAFLCHTARPGNQRGREWNKHSREASAPVC